MDSAPLNLAHFHERRADKFLRHHRFDDAFKAVEMSLLYLQDAYKNVRITKAIEVLDTQKWDLERKLRQIQMRKQQYERAKLKEIVPSKKESSSSSVLRPENSVTAQSVAKSIDKTIREFDAKFSSAQDIRYLQQKQFAKENQEPRSATFTYASVEHESRLWSIEGIKQSGQIKCTISSVGGHAQRHVGGNIATQSTSCVPATVDCEDLPALAPLELPAFDFDAFTTSAQSVSSVAGLAESFQK